MSVKAKIMKMTSDFTLVEKGRPTHVFITRADEAALVRELDEQINPASLRYFSLLLGLTPIWDSPFTGVGVVSMGEGYRRGEAVLSPPEPTHDTLPSVAGFIFDLLMSHLPVETVDRLVRENDGSYAVSNKLKAFPGIAEYANRCARRLLGAKP